MHIMDRINKIKIVLLAAVLCVLMLAGCGEKDYGTDFTTEPLTDKGYVMETLNIELPGVTEEYNLLLVADLHIICQNDEINPDELATVKGRINAFSPDGGRTTAEKMWKTMPSLLDKCNADMILFAGDMTDFCSEANTNALRDGMNSLTTPYSYIRSDHDICPFYINVEGNSDMVCAERQQGMGENARVWYTDLGQVIILCYNRSDRVMDEEGLAVVKEAIAIGKPIILLTHVPFKSLVDESLEKMNRDVFGGKDLTWAMDGTTEYDALDPVAREFLSILYSEDCPIKEVVSGHLHFSWDGQMTEYVGEHVFDAAFRYSIGYIRISGDN